MSSTTNTPKAEGPSATEQVIDRVRKLLRLATMNDSPAEAEAAMGLAQELMAKHDIAQADVLLDDSRHGELDVTDEVVTESSRAPHHADRRLLLAIGVAFGVRVHHVRDTFGRRTLHHEIRLIGLTRDVAVARALHATLRQTMRSMARQALGGYWTTEHWQFCAGFAARLLERAQRMHSTSPSGSVGTQLVLAKEGIIERWVKQQHPSMRRVEMPDPEISHAFVAGARAANGVSLTVNQLEGGIG